MSQTTHKVAILGANGYTGLELARLLLKHPCVSELAVYSRQPDWHLANEIVELNNAIKPVPHYPVAQLVNDAHQYAVIFLATPVDVSLTLVPQLLATKVKVIDLSGAFRLSTTEFAQWYATPHTAEATLTQAVYGLSPWWPTCYDPATVALIANPGCYSTCAIMSLIPLLQNNLINPATIIIDAKSGATGAGKKADANLLFCELMENFYPYKIGTHQHTPEILRYVHQYTDQMIQPIFQTHLLPVRRGIFMNIYVDFNTSNNDVVGQSGIDTITAAYEDAYGDYPFVKWGPAEHHQPLLALKAVVGTHHIHLTYQRQDNKLLVFATMDNLLKGAASQAIENFNLLNNIPLTVGL